MTEHAGQLGFILCVGQQAVVNANHSAGHGKGVELGAVDDHQFKSFVTQLAVPCELIGQVLDVVLHQRVGNGGHLTAKGFQPDAAQLMFLLETELTGAGVTEFG